MKSQRSAVEKSTPRGVDPSQSAGSRASFAFDLASVRPPCFVFATTSSFVAMQLCTMPDPISVRGSLGDFACGRCARPWTLSQTLARSVIRVALPP